MTTRIAFTVACRARRPIQRVALPLKLSTLHQKSLLGTRLSPVSASRSPPDVTIRGIHGSDRRLLGTTSQHSPPTSTTDSSSKDEAQRNDRGGEEGKGTGGGGGGNRGPLSWGAVALLAVVGTLVVGYYRVKWDEKQNRVSSEVTSTGKPALGGPFTLVDMHGRPVTDKDFHGSYVMLYFGFCHCPDICPSELVKIGAIADKLEAKLGENAVKPVFVSVDPDRDSLAQLRHYALDFHPRCANCRYRCLVPVSHTSSRSLSG